MWRQSFPSGEIFEVIVIPLPTTPLEGILSMTTVVTLSSCTATSSSGQAIISLFMGMQMCSSCVTKNKTGDSSTTTIPVDKMTVWDHLEDYTCVVLFYDEQGSCVGQLQSHDTQRACCTDSSSDWTIATTHTRRATTTTTRQQQPGVTVTCSNTLVDIESNTIGRSCLGMFREKIGGPAK